MTTANTNIELGQYLNHLDTYVSEEIHFQFTLQQIHQVNLAMREIFSQADVEVIHDGTTVKFAHVNVRIDNSENVLGWWVEDNNQSLIRAQGCAVELATVRVMNEPDRYVLEVSGWEYSGTYCRNLLTLIGRILSQGFIPEGEFTPFS